MMHGRLYNEATLELSLWPRTPLLIKSGTATGLDPALPDLAFVRTRRMNEKGEVKDEIYLPGSSLRGVIRSHAERLVRSIDWQRACDPLKLTQKADSAQYRAACLSQATLGKDERADKLSGIAAYNRSCFACRLFGNTGLASRLRVGDFYSLSGAPLTDTRHGVALDRVTGAVAQGPFLMETVTDGEFSGKLALRNFTLGQLGLLAAVLLDMDDELVPLGHAKSRGLGRVGVLFDRLEFRFPRNPEGQVRGVGALHHEGGYNLSAPEKDAVEAPGQVERKRGFFVTETAGGDARDWLEGVVSFWVEQLND
jgi:CRISPR/Cas system CSM-associated protein Csm3 (group 7 of RAMP superfamily)